MDISQEEDFFEFNGVQMQVFCLTGEQSQRDYIFICGFADPVQNHLDIFESLVDNGYRVWAVNMPGHGESGFLDNIEWGTLVAIVRRMVENYSIGSHFIGGFSMGGGVALKYASLYPESITGIKVLSPFCYKLPSITKAIIGGARFTYDFLRNGIDNPSNKEPPTGKIYPLYYAKYYPGIFRSFNLDKAELSGIPIDVVLGTEDTVVDPNLVVEQLGGIKGIKIKLIKGLTHDIYFIREETIERIVYNLVK